MGCTGPSVGYTCSGNNPTICSKLCGNSVNDTSTSPAYTEICDDGNMLNSDGCSSTCQIESNWFCSGFASTCSSCGDGQALTLGGELCDDSTNDGIGCLSGCTGPAVGYTCTGNTPSVCTLNCGNGILDTLE